MKKQIISGALAAMLLAGSCSAAFSDISNPTVAQTAAVLKSLKIMEGDSATSFAPNRSLTRAEFAKLVVTAFGITNVSAYQNYTVFPDVPNTHWAAGYINAAVKHPDIQKKNILHGYADGTFQPNRKISYGEACTMLLLMLGYSVEDIGPMWPTDYVARAQSEGLTDGTAVMDAASAVTRGDAAVMLLNTLDTNGKEGERLLTALTASADSEDVILLATSETDTDLRKNQARFYTGEEEPVIKTTDGVLDSSLIGVSGTLYYSKTSPSTVLTMLPSHEGTDEQYTVRRAQRDQIEISETSKNIKPDRTSLLYVRGEVQKYSAGWFDVQAGDKITLHYGKDGALELIRVSERDAVDTSFVYGTKNAAAVPNGFTVEKNGMTITEKDLKKYDVVSLDTANRRAIVSDAKITGYYDNAQPTYKNPEKITFMGREYPIDSTISPYFADFRAGDRITLLFNARGEVAAAYSATDVRAEMTGVFGDLADGTAQITLFNGQTVRGTLSDSSDEKLFGRAVTVTQLPKGTLSLSEKSMTGKANGDWDVQAGTIGTRKVSANVRVWEQVTRYAPLSEISLSDLPSNTVVNKDIRTTLSDTSGQITAIVLGDVTGESWNYGYGYTSSSGGVEEDISSIITATLRRYNYSTSSQEEYTYNVISRPDGAAGGAVGFPKSAEKNPSRQMLDSIKLNRIDEVKLENFDGSAGVRTSQGYYKLADEVQVYVREQAKFISLAQAKADYDDFTLYAERPADEGGKIRVITV